MAAIPVIRTQGVTHQSESDSFRFSGGEDFLFTGQVRPSAAAADCRAGPVLAPLPAAGPAAAHTKRPDDRGWKSSGHRASCSLIMLLVWSGRPSPQPILVTVDRHRSRP